MTITTDLQERLANDPVRNISTLGFIANQPITHIYQEGRTTIIVGKSNFLWAYIASDSETELTSLLTKHHIGTKFFASLEEWMIPLICKHGEMEWQLPTWRYILPPQQDVAPPGTMVSDLDVSAAKYVFTNSGYQKFSSVRYVKERIARGVSAGIVEDQTLVAWGLSHDDNALGYLHVLPSYRRKNYGEQIMRSLVWQTRQRHQPVFLNVEPTNVASTRLMTKLGFRPDRKVSWVKLR